MRGEASRLKNKRSCEEMHLKIDSFVLKKFGVDHEDNQVYPSFDCLLFGDFHDFGGEAYG